VDKVLNTYKATYVDILENPVVYKVFETKTSKVISKVSTNNEILESIRICTKQQIQNMSQNSFRNYQEKVAIWNRNVQTHGSPEVIYTINWLQQTCNQCSRPFNPPVC